MINNKKNEGENYFFVSFFIQFGDLAKQSWLGRCHWKVYVKINCKSSWKWLVVEPKYATNHLSMAEEKKLQNLSDWMRSCQNRHDILLLK